MPGCEPTRVRQARFQAGHEAHLGGGGAQGFEGLSDLGRGAPGGRQLRPQRRRLVAGLG